MFVVGTAGHIDHGKSTLVRRLTGIDPDRLSEEKARGMTIDLGFASMQLPSQRTVGLVDVPGHHRFIRNMLAGVGSINFTLFVVAATEGWMPQSQEHLAILDLLQINRGIIVLTKCDLVDDDWLLLVEDDVRAAVQGTGLADAPIARVSSTTGQGIADLVQLMERLLDNSARTHDIKRPRLWIDRVFTVHGAGSVVTGTLVGGNLHADQTVQIVPAGMSARIRRLQVHANDVAQAFPGSRVAVNLSGIERAEIRRGDAVVLSDQRPSDRLNATLRLLSDVDRGLKGVSQCHLYIGSAERLALVRVLGDEGLEPGGEGLVQMELDRTVAAELGDRFILRDQTTQRTIGGGVIVDAEPRAVRRRSLRYVKEGSSGAPVWLQPERLDLTSMAERAKASLERLVQLVVDECSVMSQADVVRQIPAQRGDVLHTLGHLGDAGRLVTLPGYVLSAHGWQRLTERTIEAVTAYHEQYPLRLGPARESVRSKLGIEAKLFDETLDKLVTQGTVVVLGSVLRVAAHTVQLSPRQEAEWHTLRQEMANLGFEAPTLEQLLSEGYDGELINWLLQEDQLVRVGGDLLYLAETMTSVRKLVAAHIQAAGGIDVGSLRDLLHTSRRYALPILEHLDQTNYTRRIGDKRILA